eukprot:Em0235g3a
MASGHTTHDIIVYTTTPRIAPVLTLTGQHGRTPWCLTFDPTNADVLYSGCLGGRLCHWDVKTGKCLNTWYSGVSAPVTSIIVPLSYSKLLLVSVDHCIYLLDSSTFTTLWRADAGKIATVKCTTYRLQLYPLSSDGRPDLRRCFVWLVEPLARITNPQSSCVITSHAVICLNVKGDSLQLSLYSIRHCSFGTVSMGFTTDYRSTHILTVPLFFGTSTMARTNQLAQLLVTIDSDATQNCCSNRRFHLLHLSGFVKLKDSGGSKGYEPWFIAVVFGG